MVDLKKADPLKLIKCDNAKCGRYSFEQDIEKNNCECPHCGRPFSMPERDVRSEVSLRETVVPSYVCDNKEKLRDLIEFLISQERAITVQIEGNKTSYTSKIIKAVYRGTPSKDGKGDELIIEKLIPNTGNAFFKFSRRIVIRFLLRNQSCRFESKYLGESAKYPNVGLVVSFPESVEMQ